MTKKKQTFDPHAEDLRKLIPGIRLEVVETDTLSKDDVTEGLRLLNEGRQSGAWVTGTPPLLLFRWKDATSQFPPPSDLLFYPWVWPDFFGTTVTVTILSRHTRTFVQIPSSSPAAKAVLSEGFIGALVRNDRVERAVRVSYPPLPTHLKTLDGPTARAEDPPAACWSFLANRDWCPNPTPEEQIQISWARAYRHAVEHFLAQLAWKESEAPPDQRELTNVPADLVELFKLSSSDPTILSKLVNYFDQTLSSPKSAKRFFEAVHQLFDPQPDNRAWLPVNSFAIYLWHSRTTNCGRQLTCFDSTEHQVAKVSLKPQELAEQGAAADYWQRILAMSILRIGWNRAIKGTDSPLDISSIISEISKLSLHRATKAELDEALCSIAAATNKDDILTEKFVFDIDLGPFERFSVHAIAGELLLVLRNRHNHYLPAYVDPVEKTISIVDWQQALDWARAQNVRIPKALRGKRLDQFDLDISFRIADALRDVFDDRPHPLFDVGTWTPLKADEALSLLKANKPTHAAGWHNHGFLKPDKLFCYLKARFGPPNGIMTLLRKQNDSDNLFHWDYTFHRDANILSIISGPRGIEFHISGNESISRGQQLRLMRAIRDDLKNHGEAIAKERKALEDWTLTINPYARLYRITATWAERLKRTTVSEPYPLGFLASKSHIAQYQEHMDRWVKSQQESSQLSTGLLMLAPVMGEAFVNLLIFLLMKDDFRSDKRLYDDMLRRQIDIRIRELHMTCRGFCRAVNFTDKAASRFQTLMNERNNLLHGNIDPNRFFVGPVFFDGYIPVFLNEDPVTHRLTNQMTKNVEPEKALDAFRVVEDFVDYLLSRLEIGFSEEMRFLAFKETFGYRKDTGRVGVLFPEHGADVILAKK